MALLFLVGYMGCGKSTIAKLLAKELGCSRCDTDKIVESGEGCSVAEIFDRCGERYFRECEQCALGSIIENNVDCVVATGGGLPLWGDNMNRMEQAGVTIYLKRSAATIARRLSPYGREKRPALRGKNDDELLRFMEQGVADRDALYSQSQVVIECDGMSDKAIVEHIINVLNYDNHVEK